MLQLIPVAALLLAAALALADQLPDWLERSRGGPGALIAACLFYAGLLAVPFMPAMELGLLIMLVFGKSGAVGAYLAAGVALP